MIVEDELVVATDLKLMLQSLGYEVCTIESSAEGALRKAGELIPDLVLMDIGLDGNDLPPENESTYNGRKCYILGSHLNEGGSSRWQEGNQG